MIIRLTSKMDSNRRKETELVSEARRPVAPLMEVPAIYAEELTDRLQPLEQPAGRVEALSQRRQLPPGCLRPGAVLAGM